MKKSIICYAVILLLCGSCTKAFDLIEVNTPSSKDASENFVKYTIKNGQHYADNNPYKKVSTSEMKFVVKFDSTVIYQSVSEENQYDINKLYGFSDNNSMHHQYSARIGWRWSDKQLRLFAYVYNNGNVSSKEMTAIPIGKEVACNIQVAGAEYIFTVNERQEKMPRESTTEAAEGYQLYPYFGGDETAPHDIIIWIGGPSPSLPGGKGSGQRD
jgi:hypothetical protein